MNVALAHDYLTQRGGAERVVLALTRTFPEAPLFTALYDAETTYGEFRDVDIRTEPLDRVTALRRHHRIALPLLAPTFSRMHIPADVAVCSSSGWAHGAKVEGKKIVYCHTPARWLYQPERYLGQSGALARIGRAVLHRPLERWDRRAAKSADLYLANSSWIAHEIERIYGIEADVLHPPLTVDVSGDQVPLSGIEPGFVLCVSRLLPYKNVDSVVRAFTRLGNERLVVAGHGPDEADLRALAGPNVTIAGSVSDAELRWLYAGSAALVAASYEDFGLTPIEAAAFGKPTAALRFGGFLDTIREGETGVFFDQPEPAGIAEALRALLATGWSESLLCEHAASFSEERFAARLREIAFAQLPANANWSQEPRGATEPSGG
jgi:glycosyltransferase involved in cell wall biosynthesis